VSYSLSIDRVEEYLKTVFKKSVKVKELSLLGSGWHAEAWRIVVDVPDEGERKLVLKFLKGEKGFGHDYPADRAQVLLMAHRDFNKLPRHVRSVDVGYIDVYGCMHSVGDYEEFFLLMEEAQGRPYIEDLREILGRGYLTDRDKARLNMLVDYLVEIHSVKFSGKTEDMRRLYLRRIRDLVGHGEMIMGVVDSAYPPDFPLMDKLREVERRALEWRWKLRNYYYRLSQVHGDYHPFNIWFKENNELIVLDRSRGEWGEPADDVTCLLTNYLWFALLHTGKFDGVFAEMFKTFLKMYIDKTGDEELLKVCQPWFSFRAIVIASPLFYPENPEDVRKKLINFAVNVMETDVFSPDMINDLIRD